MNFGGLRRLVGKMPGARKAHVLFWALNRSFGASVLRWPRALVWYLNEYSKFKKISGADSHERFKVSSEYWFPCFTDNSSKTPVDPVYFLQDTWAARKIFSIKPRRHYDVGSSVTTLGILSQWVPITMIDIRPFDISLDGLSFEKGSILNLPFADNSIESLSSLCVVEHIGLGRYGDEIDANGSEKAILELKRVLRSRGNLLLSVPVDVECRVYFNAHRAFTRDYIVQLLDGFEIVEERYQYGTGLYSTYRPDWGFGTGLYHLVKS